MSDLFDKLNLRPQERRLVVIVGAVVFVLLNFLLVWPHFGDWGRLIQRTRDAELKVKKFREELDREPAYKRELDRLQAQGSAVASEEQALALTRTVTAQAALSGVQVTRWDPDRRTAIQRTNSFFEEQTLGITVNTGEKELVDFLYSLGAGDSMIRVRSMTVQPADPNRYRLAGNFTLVASYQKNPPPRPVAPPKMSSALPKTAGPKTNSASGNPNPPTAAKPVTPSRPIPQRPVPPPRKT